MDLARLAELIEASDFAGLLRLVDESAATHDWEGMLQMRARCRDALDRGRQLWGVAQFIEYRLALEAPGEKAGPLVVEGAGRFALGPLWEVAASTHSWSELDAYIPPGPARLLAATERALRGDEVSETGSEVPLAPQAWEPSYPVAVYLADTAEFATAPAVKMEEVPPSRPGDVLDAPEILAALDRMVQAWTEESNGRTRNRVVSGDLASALATFSVGSVVAAEVSLARALADLVWTGASGGAYGRRRGTPVGRSNAWWLLAALTQDRPIWPPEPERLGNQASALSWYLFDSGEQIAGWKCQIAVVDLARNRTAVLWAVDER